MSNLLSNERRGEVREGGNHINWIQGAAQSKHSILQLVEIQSGFYPQLLLECHSSGWRVTTTKSRYYEDYCFLFPQLNMEKLFFIKAQKEEGGAVNLIEVISRHVVHLDCCNK